MSGVRFGVLSEQVGIEGKDGYAIHINKELVYDCYDKYKDTRSPYLMGRVKFNFYCLKTNDSSILQGKKPERF